MGMRSFTKLVWTVIPILLFAVSCSIDRKFKVLLQLVDRVKTLLLGHRLNCVMLAVQL